MVKLISALAGVAILFFGAAAGLAQVYKYVDKDGNVRFTNTPTSSDSQNPEFVLPEKKSEKDIEAKCQRPKAKATIYGPTGAAFSYDTQEQEAYRECLKKNRLEEAEAELQENRARETREQAEAQKRAKEYRR